MRRKIAVLLAGAICAMLFGVRAQAAQDGRLSACSVGQFADGAAIVNKHAVAVTARMGLFAGDTAGNFAPEGQVTRAQMATLMVKMLRGSQFNADGYKGEENPFSDTADFEGGWAEGYISACYEMGVVAGYGDGTFRPGQPVNTAEALTMLINAMKVDAGAGTWPAPVMEKAQKLGLYGTLSPRPDTYDKLVRDQLAVLVCEGMCCVPGQQPIYRTEGSNTDYATLEQATVANGGSEQDVWRVVGTNSLAAKVYGLKTISFAHAWDAGKVTTPATTAKQGVKSYTCTACGQAKTEELPKLSGGSGGSSAHTHSWGAWTMTGEKEHIRTCTTNAAHTQTQPHQWDLGKVIVPATQFVSGSRVHTCSVCGGTKTQAIPALGQGSAPTPGTNETPIG